MIRNSKDILKFYLTVQGIQDRLRSCKDSNN